MPDNPKTTTTEAGPPLRVGLIGVTGYALAYFEEINKLVDKGLVQWGATTVINREEAREQVAFLEAAGVPIYDNYAGMLQAEKERLDWICIPTAIGWHTRMTLDAIACGLPVLLEKPMAPTLQDVAMIQDAEKASGLVVAIGYQHNYSESTWDIKRRLLGGEIGEISQIGSICLWPRARSYYSRNDWAGCQHDGKSWILDSPLHNAISHIINLILFFAGPTLTGRADPVEIEAELYRSKPIQNFDTIRSEVLLDTGITAGVIFSHSSQDVFDPEIHIKGTRGSFTWRFSGSHTFEIGDRVETLPPEDQVAVRECMFENIVGLLKGNSNQAICTTDQAKGEVKWVNAAQDATPVYAIPPEFVSQTEEDNGDIYDVIDGFDQVAWEAYRKGCSFSELKVPWAKPPHRLDLKNYNAFLGNKLFQSSPSVSS